MKHYIIVKLNSGGKAQESLVSKIRELFHKSLEIHAAWKRGFSGYLESKAIFDCE